MAAAQKGGGGRGGWVRARMTCIPRVTMLPAAPTMRGRTRAMGHVYTSLPSICFSTSPRRTKFVRAAGPPSVTLLTTRAPSLSGTRTRPTPQTAPSLVREGGAAAAAAGVGGGALEALGRTEFPTLAATASAVAAAALAAAALAAAASAAAACVLRGEALGVSCGVGMGVVRVTRSASAENNYTGATGGSRIDGREWQSPAAASGWTGAYRRSMWECHWLLRPMAP